MADSTALPAVTRGRRVKLKIGEHYGHITGLEQDMFQVTYDSVLLTEGGRARSRSGGRYWYRLPAIARFEVMK